MKLIRGLDYSKKLTHSVVTIGNFDGLHLGHQQLIDAVKYEAKTQNIHSVLLTFEPYSKEFFSSHYPLPRMMRFQEKWMILLEQSIDVLCCLRFNRILADLSPSDFVKKILVDLLGAKIIVIGDDFRFGKNREGDISLLKSLGKQYGFLVIAISPVKHHEKRISSSQLRSALACGDFDEFHALTQRSYCMTGKVAHGNKVGKKIGYPTANIFLRRKMVPLSGVFVAKVYGLSDIPYRAVASLGFRPSFHGKQMILEVHLFDFNQNIYGRRISVEFLHKIRDEMYFESVPLLVEQIQKDVEIAKRYFVTE